METATKGFSLDLCRSEDVSPFLSRIACFVWMPTELTKHNQFFTKISTCPVRAILTFYLHKRNPLVTQTEETVDPYLTSIVLSLFSNKIEYIFKPFVSHSPCQVQTIQASRVSRFRFLGNAFWDRRSRKVSTNSRS